jgi:cytochrome c
MRFSLLGLVLIGVIAAVGSAWADGDANLGGAVFARACVPCHALKPDQNMTGPSLAGLWGRKAGGLQSFSRYSPALKSANVVWDDGSLNIWLRNPAQFIPDNRMTFRGIPDSESRADVIAYLKEASAPGASAQTAQNAPMAGMMGRGELPNLKKLAPAEQVKAIRYCRDTYHVTTGDGETHDFWERNLRLKTDSGEIGPPSGAPALVGAGMMGDRADVIFASPQEISSFIKPEC